MLAVVIVQSLSHVWLFATPWTAARQTSLSLAISWSLPKFSSIEAVMPSNHLILCHPLLLSPSIFPSFKVFSNELALCIKWPKHWRFSCSISSSNEYSGLVSIRIDWFDLLAVQRTLKSLLQHRSSKASILWQLTFIKSNYLLLTSFHSVSSFLHTVKSLWFPFFFFLSFNVEISSQTMLCADLDFAF